MQYLESEVRSGTLHLEQQEGVNLWPREPINFFLTVEKLDSVAVSGSGDVEAPDLSAERDARLDLFQDSNAYGPQLTTNGFRGVPSGQDDTTQLTQIHHESGNVR